MRKPKVPKHTPLERALMKVAVGDCWEWTASKDKHGYGQLVLWVDGRRKLVRAHRFIYEELVGSIPAGMDLDHLCRNRACVNPDHLEPVTRRINLARGVMWWSRGQYAGVNA